MHEKDNGRSGKSTLNSEKILTAMIASGFAIIMSLIWIVYSDINSDIQSNSKDLNQVLTEIKSLSVEQAKILETAKRNSETIGRIETGQTELRGKIHVSTAAAIDFTNKTDAVLRRIDQIEGPITASLAAVDQAKSLSNQMCDAMAQIKRFPISEFSPVLVHVSREFMDDFRQVILVSTVCPEPIFVVEVQRARLSDEEIKKVEELAKRVDARIIWSERSEQYGLGNAMQSFQSN